MNDILIQTLVPLSVLVVAGGLTWIIKARISSRTRDNKPRVWKCSNCGRTREKETEMICPACRKGPFVEV